MLRVLDFLNARELGEVAGSVVLLVGMTPNVPVRVPASVDGVSWAECYERGMERLARPEGLG
jgi:hypothetical protein